MKSRSRSRPPQSFFALAVLACALRPGPCPAAEVRGLSVELSRVDGEKQTAYYRVRNHTPKAVFAFRLDFPQLQTGRGMPGAGRMFWPQAGEEPGGTSDWPFGPYGEFIQAWTFTGSAPPEAHIGGVIYTDGTFEGDPAHVKFVADSCWEQEQYLRLQVEALEEAIQRFPSSWDALAAAAARLRSHAAGIESAVGGRLHPLASRLRAQADAFDREKENEEEWGADPAGTLRNKLERLRRQWTSQAAMGELLRRSSLAK